MIDRRSLLATLGAAAAAPAPAAHAEGDAALLEDLGRRTFRWFWDVADLRTGLTPDREPTARPFCSIAATGFALTAYIIGAERGWVSREAAGARTLRVLRTFDRLPSGPGTDGVSGHRGFFYHFLDLQSGLRVGRCELSTVDTALLHLGMLHAGCAFDGEGPDEREIRRLAARIVARAEWPWFTKPSGAVAMGWSPETGFTARDWVGYNEGKMVYVLGLGSEGHPLPAGAWDRWTATYLRFWRGEGRERHLAFGPLFGHQYSEMWIDFRGVRDAPMRAAGFDYWENGRRAAYADRVYCLANPGGWRGYGGDLWGLTACDGPADVVRPFGGRDRTFYGYAARGPVDAPDGRDDGVLAPTAALGSLAAAPEIALPTLRALRRFAAGRLYGAHGFVDAFNPSFTFADAPVQSGAVDPALGWIDDQRLGIDQGPILGAVANHRDGAVWRATRRSAVIRRGLLRAGFTGGWLRDAG